MALIKKIIVIMNILIIYGYGNSNPENVGEKMNSIYNFSVTSIEGNTINLSKYQGKVILIVNVASKCGFTSQYKSLQEIYTKYKDQGFIILGFPANNFLWQEPGTDKEIETFCSLNYNVSFQMFSKISVKGKNTNPLYQFLTEKSTKKFNGKIGWNFTKFLINKEGIVVDRFTPKTKPNSIEITKRIEEELKK